MKNRIHFLTSPATFAAMENRDAMVARWRYWTHKSWLARFILTLETKPSCQP